MVKLSLCYVFILLVNAVKMEQFKTTRYERLQSDDEEENEDLPPQVHVTAPGGEGNGKNGWLSVIFCLKSKNRHVISNNY